MDNSAATAAQLHRVLPSLKWVKEDVTHMMRRIMRELPRGHPMISEGLTAAEYSFPLISA